MSEPVSLEATLSERWLSARQAGEEAIREADYNLGRISLIYGGQLSFRILEDDIANASTADISPSYTSTRPANLETGTSGTPGQHLPPAA